MTTIAEARPPVTGGVDTHLDVHVAAVVTAVGGVLGTEQFPTTAAGYQQLLAWMRGFGELARVGVEGTGTYGVSLVKHLRTQQVTGATAPSDTLSRPAHGIPARRCLVVQGRHPPDTAFMTNPAPMKDLSGVALVTGSSSGIGASVARALGQAGMAVVVNSRTSVEAGQMVAADLPSGSYIQADISDEAAAQRLVAEVVEQHGRLDLVVNNAGTTAVIPHADLDGATTDVWRRIFETNVLGTWHVTKAAVPHLRAAGAGHVVNMTSIAGVRPTGSSIPYAVSKAALNHLTSLLALALGPQIRVNAVAPGLVDTPWTADWNEVREAVRTTAPLRRSASPEDVAAVVLGLQRSTYVTGEVVLVDGGLHLR